MGGCSSAKLRDLESVGADVVKVETLLTLMERHLNGLYNQESGESSAKTIADVTLRELGEKAQNTVRGVSRSSQSLPKLHPGWPHPFLD